MFVGECLPVVRDIGVQAACRGSVEVLKLFAAVQLQLQVMFVACYFEFGRVGKYYLRLVESSVGFVYYHVVEHSRFVLFFLYVQVYVGNAVVECSFGDVEGRCALVHAEEQRPQLVFGIWARYVLEVERHASYGRYNHNQRPHNAYERNAGAFHGQQLEAFDHVAERYKRRKQYGQRNGLRNYGKSHVPEELGKDVHGKPLADEFVDVPPRKLHH